MALIHIIGQVQEGDRIVVAHTSTRSEENQTKSGRVTRTRTEPDSRLEFRRDDGQLMVIEDGELRSPGSHFPFTGEVLDVKVDDEFGRLLRATA